MLRLVMFGLLLISLSGCCVIESLTYEQTVDDMIERERDLKSHPALLNGVGFSA